MKKVISLLLAALLCIGVCCGCGEKAKSDKKTESKTESQTESASEQTPSVQSESQTQTESKKAEPTTPEPEKAEPTYYHAAIKGAVILEQDGSPNFVYCKKCDACGYTQSNIRTNVSAKLGEMHSSFLCFECHQNQEIVIKTTQTD